MKNENQPSGDDIQVIGTIEQSMHNLYSYIMQFKFCKATSYIVLTQGRRKVWKYGGGASSNPRHFDGEGFTGEMRAWKGEIEPFLPPSSDGPLIMYVLTQSTFAIFRKATECIKFSFSWNLIKAAKILCLIFVLSVYKYRQKKTWVGLRAQSLGTFI